MKLKQVRVEEVILNQLGQRSIRLDAWAADETGRQFSTEMQNDTETDDVRRRSRYYQGRQSDSEIGEKFRSWNPEDLSEYEQPERKAGAGGPSAV